MIPYLFTKVSLHQRKFWEWIETFFYFRDNYYDRYLLDSPYNLCRDPLMRKGELSATSSAQQRGPEEVWLGAFYASKNRISFFSHSSKRDRLWFYALLLILGIFMGWICLGCRELRFSTSFNDWSRFNQKCHGHCHSGKLIL